jgi:signal transduction histidine kinase/ActR/RegA family two-component response regulator
MQGQLFELAQASPPVTASTVGVVVYERFQADPDCMALAVIDDQDRPIGILERNEVFRRMAAEYGRAVFANRPASLLMNAAPLVVDGSTPVAEFCGQVLADRPSELMHGFIVTNEGRYLGVGSVLSLLKATSDANRAHAEEMTKAATRLDRAKKQAQAALNARSQFLATMTHEIRTPLNGVLAIAELLSRTLEATEQRAYVETIIRSGETLLRLLTDALDLSRSGAGALALLPEPFRMAVLEEDLHALWAPRAAQKGLKLEVVYEGPADLWAMGDLVRIKQVLNNLIGNAIKFTDQGAVQVRLTAKRRSGQLKLYGEVADTGVGIPEDRLVSIFAPFGQTPEGMARGGAGLGLSVCRELATLMGGSLHAERRPEGGSVFVLKVMLDRAEEPAAAESEHGGEAAALPRLKVLVADDNATNRMVARTLLDHLGCDSETVENGALAVEAARTGRFDLVLMDIKMPVMDGVSAVRAIRALPAPACETPCLALTANADPWDAAQYLADGMDAVVEKPIKIERLAETIAKVLQVERRRAA